jgi:hypothetical protein
MPPSTYGLPTQSPQVAPNLEEQRRQLERNLGLPSHERPGLLPPKQQRIHNNQSVVVSPQERIINRPPTGGIDSGGGGNLGLKWAFGGGTGGAASPLINEIGGEFNWYAAGIIDNLLGGGKKVLLENSSANLVQRSFYANGEASAIAIRKVPTLAREAIAKIPSFEIPTIKIPKLDMPELPSLDLPKIPEFDLPEIPQIKIPGFPRPTIPELKPQKPKIKDRDEPRIRKPKPKPIPKNKTRQLRELELSECGFISFGYVRATKITGVKEVYNQNGDFDHYESIQSSVGMEQVYNDWIKYNLQPEDQPPTLEEFIESGGDSGYIQTVPINQFTSYQAYYGIGNSINADQPTRSHPFKNLYFPYYSYGSSRIAVYGINNNSAINAILNNLDGDYPGEVYKINVSNHDAKDCPIGKPPPPPDEPPEPPDQNCDCMAQCCPDIDYRKIRAIVQEELKKLDLVSAIPLSWQIRNEGNKPQMVIQCAEENGVDKDGNKKYKSAMYPISVPHWDGSPEDKISLPSYIKGNYEGIYVLSDNSKVTINAKNEIECKRILSAIKPKIPRQYRKDAYFKGGLIVRDEPIKESRVKPKYGRYFKNGQRNNKPDWRVDFL